MSESGTGKLYTPQLLSLATELAAFPFSGDWPHVAEARSPTCGSSLKIGIEPDCSGAIARLGLAVSACAVGQAAAAVFARAAQGSSAEEIAQALGEIGAWLGDPAAPLPDWPGFAALEAARSYPARHGAMLLAWKGAAEALCKGQASR